MTKQNSFPAKLHAMLQDADKSGFNDLISWQSEGESFMIHQPERFAANVMQRYFPQTVKYKSFQRQLNIYGFRRIHQGPNKGAYRQRHFKRQHPEQCSLIIRKSSRRKTGGAAAAVGRPFLSTVASGGLSATGTAQRGVASTPNNIAAGVHHQQPSFLPPASGRSSNQESNRSTNVAEMSSSSAHFNRGKIEMDDTEMKMLYDIFYPHDTKEQNLMSSALSFDDNHDLDDSEETAVSSSQNDESHSSTASSSSEEDIEMDTFLSFVESAAPTTNSKTYTNSSSRTTSIHQNTANSIASLFEEDNQNKIGYNQVEKMAALGVHRQEDEDTEDLEHIFPFKLHSMLDDAANGGFDSIISWVENGTAFKVHNRDAFVELVMPNYFDQTKYESFRRQLNLYGFIRINRGARRGTVFHRCFVQGDRSLCRFIERQPSATTSGTSDTGVATSTSNYLNGDC